MKKTGLQLTGWILLASMMFLWMVKGSVFSYWMSRALHVPVTAEILSCTPSRLQLKELFIRNPRGFAKRYAMKASGVSVSYNWTELRKDPSVIDFIELDDVLIHVEYADPAHSSNNWSRILSRMSKLEKHKDVKIKTLRVNDLKVELLGPQMPAEIKSVGQIELYDIKSQNGFPTEELIQAIFGQANLLELIEDVIPIGPQGWLEKIFRL